MPEAVFWVDGPTFAADAPSKGQSQGARCGRGAGACGGQDST